jgi:hypothetical protein
MSDELKDMNKQLDEQLKNISREVAPEEENIIHVEGADDITVDDLVPETPLKRTSDDGKDAVPIDPMKIRIGGLDYSPEQVLAAAAALQQKMVREANGAKYDLNAAAQTMNLKNLVLKNGELDYSSMSENDAYDFDIPIVAKPFSNEDSLEAKLKDSNYVPRWVNVNPMRLGSMRSRGFEYVVADDLAQPLNIEVGVDAQGHYRVHDVVLCKILKSRYFSALRAIQLRSINAVSAIGAHRAAKNAANQYMEHETGGEYANYVRRNKVTFYSPEVPGV